MDKPTPPTTLLRGIAWVRVGRNGQCITLGKAHIDRACLFLRSYTRAEREPRIIPVRGPVLKHLKWCQECLNRLNDKLPEPRRKAVANA